MSKTFGSVRAVDNISIQVAAGEVHAVLGPNGASKTTFLRVLFGDTKAPASADPPNAPLSQYSRPRRTEGSRVVSSTHGK